MSDKPISLRRQIISQILAILVLISVIFPVLWVVSMALDPRDLARPTSLLPAGASLKSFSSAIASPTPNPINFWQLARNSALLAMGVSAFTVLVGTTAAYAFSRFRFPGRQAGMLAFVIVLMIPSTATLASLFVMLNIVIGPTLRNSLVGVGIAMVAGALPFSIWNMKGFIDTIPKDLEEAAFIDGCTANETFWYIMMPLALPGLAVTALYGFMSGWTEFVLSWQFLSEPRWFTLSMALYGMQGQYASNTPWSKFAAMSIMVSIPVLVVFFVLQRYLTSGLTAGGVKG